ncbi:MAG: GIY-YIG nuclease family protein, partial [Gammaproteobacteria bacterium]
MGHAVGDQLADGTAGTYVLVLRADRCAALPVGRLGTLQVRRGYYLYVGSALGPGGLRARLGHHLRHAARPRWHIDYLRGMLAVREIWYTCDPRRWESAWAQVLAGLPGMSVPLAGFGASDCPGENHLFHSPRRPALARLSACAGAADRGFVVHRLI